MHSNSLIDRIESLLKALAATSFSRIMVAAFILIIILVAAGYLIWVAQ